MRHGRHKNSRKHLQYLTLNNLLPTPLTILLCPTYIHSALSTSVPLLTRISSLLSLKDVRYVTTKESVEELMKIKPEYGKWCEENVEVLPECGENDGNVRQSLLRISYRNDS
ncbi:hypothetical protein TrVE_jg7418 [Triparma verrucosa]|uniref:Uncharacterized protein n=1 Tax=Triparma verrucosa TaxID=1606542 RepID=A0A9W7FCX7_9STRA|nr:hypothetical protein TrVE_jg7418 [Triparma verrucosa]